MTVMIIGGGSAGFFAAITCAEANPDARIIILEKGNDVLQKVKVSGGGRCNVTHACFDPKELVNFYPRGQKELIGPFTRFQPADMVEWLENRGVKVKAEEDGRMFPVSDNSQTIIDCFLRSARQLGVQWFTKKNVVNVSRRQADGAWLVGTQDGSEYPADRLMVAGGSSKRLWDMMADLGHTIVPPVPSLFTFNIKDERLKDLLGLSVPNAFVQVTGTKLQSKGPLLITHWGLSGPAILKLSAWGARELALVNYQFQIRLSWTNSSTEEVLEELLALKMTWAKKAVDTQNPFSLPQRLWKKLVHYSGINTGERWADLSGVKLEKLAKEVSDGIYEVRGKSTFKEEFVTAGGVSLQEIDFRNFESRIHKNLYFAGEMLDIDAVTGGFNFQAAWTGGYLAGLAMAK